MKLTALKAALAGAAMLASSTATFASDWQPNGPIKMMIAFAAGGGADTQARLLAEELGDRKGWQIIPENVTGKSGATMAVALKDEPNDGMSLGIAVTELFGYNVQAIRNPGFSNEDFTFLSTITGTQMGLIAKADRGWKTLGDVIEAAKAGEQITVGAMAQKLADGTYVIGKANDVEFTSVMVKGGKGGLNGVVADDLDVAWAAGVQAKGVTSGDLINLVSLEAEPLKVSPDAPLITEYNVPFTFGTKFVVVAPAGLPGEARTAIQDAIAEIANDPESKLNSFITQAFSGPDVIAGADLEAHIAELFEQSGALLDASAE